MNKKVIYFSRFEPTNYAGGGCRRLMQIIQALESFKLDVIACLKDFPLRRHSFWKERVNAVIPSSKIMGLLDKYWSDGFEYSLWNKEHRKVVYRRKYMARQWAEAIEDIENIEAAIVDDPIYFLPIINELKKYGIPIVAMCHNIETLTPEHVEPAYQIALLNKELEILRDCNLVVTISREETFLLNNLGIKTTYFPYYPVDTIVKRLMSVRTSRQCSKKKDTILLGTAWNKPTRNSMIIAINAWKRYELYKFVGTLLIAGFGTDSLKEFATGDDIKYLGSLSDDALDTQLSTVKGCLCYQEKGSGALTRISEMLIAGVPVIANAHAARSYYNLKGVYEFHDFEEIEQAFLKVEEDSGEIPIPSPPDAAGLISAITNSCRRQ